MKLYPQTFLAEFGDSIDQTFRDSLRDASQARGNWGVALLWLRIIPDFIFSVVELLTSTAGDYLKWYFRLRWVLACGLGFALGQIAASSLVAAGVLEYVGLPRQWGLLGVPIWLSLGFFQSRVLTNRFCSRWQWTLLTVAAGVLGILTNRELDAASPIRMVAGLETTKAWLSQFRFTETMVPLGVLIGFFQWSALKPSVGHRSSGWWAAACACAAYGSATISVISSWIAWPMANVFSFGVFQFLHAFLVGATFGLISAIPLKRMLWTQSAEVSRPEPARDAEV